MLPDNYNVACAMTQLKKLLTPLSFMGGVVVVLGVYVLVRAVAPGTVTTPTFDPPIDVDLQASLDCVRVGPVGSPAVCPAGYILTGGGGNCSEDDSDNPSIYPDFALNRFVTSCDSASGPQAVAVCCRIL